MENIFSIIESCINDGAIIDFKNYLKSLGECKKWMVHSDYCIGDKNKSNDVAVFSILPHLTTYEDQTNLISQNILKDIKKCKSIKENSIKIIQSGLFFHFCFVLSKRRTFFQKSKSENEKQNIISAVKESQKIINTWDKNENLKKDYYLIDDRINALLRKMERKSFNVKLFKDIILIALFAAYTTHLLTKEANAEIVGWFSDRDKLTSSYKKIAFDLFYLNHLGFSKRDSVDTSKFKLVIGVPSEKPGTKMWYDPQNRIPDHIAGTLADYNFNKCTVSKQKFSDMVSKCLTREHLFAIIKCSFSPSEFKCSRVIFEKNKRYEPGT